MDISSVSSAYLPQEIQTPDIQTKYAAKCLLMARESTAVVGNLLQDTAEISNEAMQRFLAERNK